MTFLKKIKAHDLLLFLIVHIGIKKCYLFHILILCMIENLFYCFMTYNENFLT
jgi:hypothetical protein